jgi:transcriptional regulator with XRE-family HTH domain
MSYISRVENGHTVPAIETLEKMARAMEIPMYAHFYDGEKPPDAKLALARGDHGFGARGKDSRTLERFRRLLGRNSPQDQKLLLTWRRRWRHATSRRGTMSFNLPPLRETWVAHQPEQLLFDSCSQSIR